MISVNANTILTPLLEDDLEELAVAINDPLVSSNTLTIPYPYTMDDARAFYERIAKKREDAGYPTEFAIKIDGKLAGCIGLVCAQGYHHHRSEIGYWISAAYRGKGIMKSVIGAFCQHIFDTLTFKRIEAITYCDNIASQRVLEVNEFVREGMLRKYVVHQNKTKDVYIYSRLHPSF